LPAVVFNAVISFSLLNTFSVFPSSVVKAPGKGERPRIKLCTSSTFFVKSILQVSVKILGA
jgi:hypothetical protein